MKNLIKIFMYLSVSFFSFSLCYPLYEEIDPFKKNFLDFLQNELTSLEQVDDTYINEVIKYRFNLGIVTRLKFVNNVEESFSKKIIENNEIQQLLDDHISNETKKIIKDELIGFYDLFHRVDSFIYNNDILNFNEKMDLYKNVFLENLENNLDILPFYVFNHINKSIHIRFENYSQDYILDFSSYNSLQFVEEEINQNIINEEKQNIFKTNYIDFIFSDENSIKIKNLLSNSMMCYDIIPNYLLEPIFKIKYQLQEYNELNNKNVQKLSELEFLVKRRRNIGKVFKTDEENLNEDIKLFLNKNNYENNISQIKINNYILLKNNNKFWGPKIFEKQKGGRTDYPGFNFELNSRILIQDFYDEFYEYNKQLILLNDKIKKNLNITKINLLSKKDIQKINLDSVLKSQIEDITDEILDLFSRVSKKYQLENLNGIPFNYLDWNFSNHINKNNIGKWNLRSIEDKINIYDDFTTIQTNIFNDYEEIQPKFYILDEELLDDFCWSFISIQKSEFNYENNNYYFKKYIDKILNQNLNNKNFDDLKFEYFYKNNKIISFKNYIKLNILLKKIKLKETCKYINTSCKKLPELFDNCTFIYNNDNICPLQSLINKMCEEIMIVESNYNCYDEDMKEFFIKNIISSQSNEIQKFAHNICKNN